jgi:DMATS type aromatic prenyltransferase
MFLAFEFGDSEPVVKAYLILWAKSSTSGQAEELVMDNVLSRFAQKQCWPELQDLAEILRDRGRSLQLRPFMIAVDCVSPPDARLKIYCRSPDTSLAAVEHTLSLFEDRSTISNGLREIRVLWHLLFALDDSETGSRQLPHLDMQTAGMLYYIEIRPRARKRTVKVYLPIKHYAKNDLQAAHGLTTFLQRRERGMEQVCDKYLQALGVMCSHRTLQSSLGLQTYVSCAIEDDRLSLTSYLSPEVYCPGRAEKQPE